MTFAGILGGTLTGFTFPGLYGISTNYPKNIVDKFILYTFTVVTTMIGLVGTYYSILNFKIE